MRRANAGSDLPALASARFDIFSASSDFAICSGEYSRALQEQPLI
jgi:hypothetical protein